MNLAFADLLYCAIELPVIAIHYLHQTWDWGFASCYITASFRYLISYVEWMSIAWIAFTRCILVTNNQYFKSILKAKNRRLLIFSTWIYAVLLLMPTFLEVLTHHPQTYLEINENATSKILYFAFLLGKWNIFIQLPPWQMWLHPIPIRRFNDINSKNSLSFAANYHSIFGARINHNM